jgi:hypothetical protein
MPIIHTLSDHAAILLSTDGTLHRVKCSFKFENWWLKEDEFQNYAKNDWLSTANRSFSARTNHLAGTLKIWCKKKKPLHLELNNIEEQIKQIQMKPLAQQDHALEMSLATRYEQSMTKLTDYYMQRAKKQWIKDGDRNTTFFHHAVVKRRRRNTIVSVKDEYNVLQFMPDKISNTFVNYFRSIFASGKANTGRPFIGTNPPQDTHDCTYSIPDEHEILDTQKCITRTGWLQCGILHSNMGMDWE